MTWVISIFAISLCWLYLTGVLYGWQTIREEGGDLDSGDWALIISWPLVLPLAWALRKINW